MSRKGETNALSVLLPHSNLFPIPILCWMHSKHLCVAVAAFPFSSFIKFLVTFDKCSFAGGVRL